MKYPNLSEEKKLWKKGFNVVMGLDEVGRGPLAGSVVAGAVLVRKNSKINLLVKDSKKLSEKKREELYKLLTNCEDIKWGIGIVSEKIIDKINILEATKLAMMKAISNLNSKLQIINSKQISNSYLLIDGNQALKFSEKFKMFGRALIATEYSGFKDILDIPRKTIIKGDQKVFSISCASIIAKVTRDRIMKKLDKKYPEYGFIKHKGYGTKLHLKNLKKFGASKIHRKSFYPVSLY